MTAANAGSNIETNAAGNVSAKGDSPQNLELPDGYNHVDVIKGGAKAAQTSAIALKAETKPEAEVTSPAKTSAYVATATETPPVQRDIGSSTVEDSGKISTAGALPLDVAGEEVKVADLGTNAGASKATANEFLGRLGEIESEKAAAEIAKEIAAEGDKANLATLTAADGAVTGETAATGEAGAEEKPAAEGETKTEVAAADAVKESEKTPESAAAGATGASKALADEKAKKEAMLAELGIPTGAAAQMTVLEDNTRGPAAVNIVALDPHHPDSLFHALAMTLIEEDSSAAATTTETAGVEDSTEPAEATKATEPNKTAEKEAPATPKTKTKAESEKPEITGEALAASTVPTTSGPSRLP